MIYIEREQTPNAQLTPVFLVEVYLIVLYPDDLSKEGGKKKKKIFL